METPHFLEWFSNVFLKHTNAIEGPKILIFDGHLSHISLETVEKAVENNIHIILLPSHTTHFLQPLDVGVFPAVKNEWRRVLKEHLITSNFSNVTKHKFTELFLQLIKSEKAFKRLHAIVGFEESGIFPINLKKMLSKVDSVIKESNSDSSDNNADSSDVGTDLNDSGTDLSESSTDSSDSSTDSNDSGTESTESCANSSDSGLRHSNNESSDHIKAVKQNNKKRKHLDSRANYNNKKVKETEYIEKNKENVN